MFGRARAVRLVGGVVLTLLMGACGNDTSASSSPTATAASPEATSTAGNAELCAQRDALESSLQDLRNVDIRSGTAGIQAALTEVRTSLQGLRTAAKGEYRDQIDAADNALQELETAVTNVDSGGVGPVVTAAGNVVTTGGALLESLRNLNCG